MPWLRSSVFRAGIHFLQEKFFIPLIKRPQETISLLFRSFVENSTCSRCRLYDVRYKLDELTSIHENCVFTRRRTQAFCWGRCRSAVV